MRINVIACRVFEPELNWITARSEGPGAEGASTEGPSRIRDQLKIDWLPLRAHDQPDVLRKDIQALIDAAVDFDAVVLAYGLCGNATSGLRAAGIPLYIPRAHDCSQILLGCRADHRRFFGENPSRGWTSRGYLESEDEPFRVGEGGMDWDMKTLIEHYGEENAQYVWDTLHGSDSADDPVLYFLDVPETQSPEVLKRAVEKAGLRGKTLEVIPATLALLARLLDGRGGNEILRVPPGCFITPSWDDEVLRFEGELV